MQFWGKKITKSSHRYTFDPQVGLTIKKAMIQWPQHAGQHTIHFYFRSSNMFPGVDSGDILVATGKNDDVITEIALDLRLLENLPVELYYVCSLGDVDVDLSGYYTFSELFAGLYRENVKSSTSKGATVRSKEELPTKKATKKRNQDEDKARVEKKQKVANDMLEEVEAEELPQTRRLANGLEIYDALYGIGDKAVKGRHAVVKYELFSGKSGKKLESTHRKPFEFKIGAGKVIKGWDVGILGMRVGGRRTLRVPPDMAYGAKGSPPKIPPNSTLVFDIELVGLK